MYEYPWRNSTHSCTNRAHSPAEPACPRDTEVASVVMYGPFLSITLWSTAWHSGRVRGDSPGQGSWLLGWGAYMPHYYISTSSLPGVIGTKMQYRSGAVEPWLRSNLSGSWTGKGKHQTLLQWERNWSSNLAARTIWRNKVTAGCTISAFRFGEMPGPLIRRQIWALQLTRTYALCTVRWLLSR